MSVGAEVLVAETSGDLEIPVETGDHQQLLIELRRLWKCVELAGVDPARHEIIARAFRGGLRKNRGLDLQITALVQIPPCRLLQTVTEYQVSLELRAPKVQVSMPQAEVFGGEVLAPASGDWNRGDFRSCEYGERSCAQLDVS